MTDGRIFDGKVALVIGGTRNLGAAIADVLAAGGATTVVSYRDDADAAEQTVARLRARQGTVWAVCSDATVCADVDSLFEAVVAQCGRLDITVHVPGAVTKKPLVDFTNADFDHLIDLNTRSAFYTLRAASRHLADNGRYIVLSTTLTSVMAGPYGVYSGAKAAVERMVLAAAKELGNRGITVNAVAPGPVDDEFYHSAETAQAVTHAKQATPFGRLGRPEDVAPVVEFLAGPGAGWISGQTIRVNGAMF